MSRPTLDIIEGSDTASRQAAAWFARLRADDASEGDRRQWRQWMDHAPEHRLAYARLESLWSSFGDHAPTPEVAARVRQARARPASSRRRPLLAVAAVLVLGLTAGLAWLFRASTPQETVYANAVGERRLLQLEDGTRVDLDSGATLRVRFGRHERLLTLERGRAFFRVAPQPRPLRVEAGAGSVRAIGTQFEVDRHADAIDVALFEGRVDLLSSAADPRHAVHLASLDAGQSARVAGHHVELSGPVQAGDTPSWLSGRLTFDDQPLSHAVAEFNRYSTHLLRLGDPALADRRVSGSFRSDAAAGFVEALDVAYGIGHRRGNDGAIVLTESRQ